MRQIALESSGLTRELGPDRLGYHSEDDTQVKITFLGLNFIVGLFAA